MTSEVVTNALRYSTGALSFGVESGQDKVRVEVGDDGPGRPRARAVGQDAESGRGLQIVEALSSCWGVHGSPLGKVVWFEVLAQP